MLSGIYMRVVDFIVGSVSKIFDGCLRLGYFIDAWKEAHYIRIILKKDPSRHSSLASSYRLTSLLPILGKWFEIRGSVRDGYFPIHLGRVR